MGGDGRKVVIFGTGDFARIACVYLERDSPHEIVAFTVDERYPTGEPLLGREVVAFERVGERFPPGEYAMLVAVGFSRVNRNRADVFAQAKARGYELISYVSSNADVWGHVEIGENTFILEENVIQPFVTIGDDVALWSGNHIGLDATIEDHCFITSHAVVSGHGEMQAYPFVTRIGGRRMLLYNGDGYGRTGIGYAVDDGRSEDRRAARRADPPRA